MSAPDSVLIVAGEASADLHGAKLVRELKARHPELVVFGIGGEAMRAHGLEVTARAEDISVAGLTEVLFALPRILGIARRLVHEAAARRPKVAVLLDLPDFNLRLAKRLHKLGIPVVYYISPQVWAWREKRVHEIRRIVSRMLVILPFEKAFYERFGVPVEYVGHPLVEDLPAAPDRPAARRALGIAQEGLVVALLPGSRKKELARHLPLMLEAFAAFRLHHPDARALIPVASTIPRELVTRLVAERKLPVEVIDGRATEILTAADAAVVCSGTATLQTALLQRPMVVVYKVSWLTYHIVKRLVRVAHIAVVNLIAGRTLVKELIQDAFTASSVAAELEGLTRDEAPRRAMVAELASLRAKLGEHPATRRVAEVVGEYLQPAHAPTAHASPSPEERP